MQINIMQWHHAKLETIRAHGCNVLRPFTPTPEMGIERKRRTQTLRISDKTGYGQNNKHKTEDTNLKKINSIKGENKNWPPQYKTHESCNTETISHVNSESYFQMTSGWRSYRRDAEAYPGHLRVPCVRHLLMAQPLNKHRSSKWQHWLYTDFHNHFLFLP